MNVPAEIKDDWTLYEGLWGNGLPILVRVRNGLESYVGSQEYQCRYMITWALQNPRDDGFPSSSDNDALENFENLVFDQLEAGQHSICVAVVTNNGERDWIFYTSDPEEIHKRLNQALQESPIFPIRPSSCPDPDWAEFNGIVANIRNMSR
ncbi:MAG: DUF695 domain-containing protein [Phycisphaerae bacterium]|jgi:hypothetical protein|nr:DUF695 domain-containing protein [Phycisphaerae bacterium]